MCSTIYDDLGGVLCPVDSLARCMLAFMLPEQWKESVEQWQGVWRMSSATIDRMAEWPPLCECNCQLEGRSLF
jgi:hypothetical protein